MREHASYRPPKAGCVWAGEDKNASATHARHMTLITQKGKTVLPGLGVNSSTSHDLDGGQRQGIPTRGASRVRLRTPPASWQGTAQSPLVRTGYGCWRGREGRGSLVCVRSCTWRAVTSNHVQGGQTDRTEQQDVLKTRWARPTVASQPHRATSHLLAVLGARRTAHI